MATHNVGALINRQMRRWEIQQPRSDEPPRPCVAISRLPHAWGARVGRGVAERLDYGFFGREILESIAQEQGIRQRLVEGVDEQVLSTIDRVVADLFHLRSFTETDYLREVARAITTLGRRGSAVLLGRGATSVLPARSALRVLLVASVAVRAERLAASEGLAPDVAEKRLALLDQKRSEFTLHHFGVRQDDPVLYDLVVNTGTLEPEAAVDLIVEALRRRFPGSAPRASAGA